MSRKSKRQTRRKTSATASTSEVLKSNGFGRDFSPDYTQTKKDLQRIAALAGSFFVVLIILSFFLR
jgi:hypothetical protein